MENESQVVEVEILEMIELLATELAEVGGGGSVSVSV